MPVQREIILSSQEWGEITHRFNAIAHDFRFSGPDAMYGDWLSFEMMLANRGLGRLLTAETVMPDPITRRGSRLCLIAQPEYTGRIRVDDASRASQEQVLLHVLDAPQEEGQWIQIILPELRARSSGS